MLLAVSLVGGLGSRLRAPHAAAAPDSEPGIYGTLPAAARTNPIAVDASAPAGAPAGRASTVPFVNKLRQPDAPVRGRASAATAETPSTSSPIVVDVADPGPPSLAPTGTTNFAGMGSTVNTLGYRPPDPILAAGPNQIIEMTNVFARVFDKSGGTLSTFSLASFFGVTAGWAQADPKVIFDPLSNRFFATYISLIDNPSGSDFAKLHIAVSTTSNPLDAWNLTSIPFTNEFPDYESIAASNDKITISWNRFDIDATTNAYIGAQTLVLDKSPLLAGTAAGTFTTVPSQSYFTIRPAQMMTASNDQFMVSADFPSGTSIHLWKVTGTPAAANVSVTDIAQPATGAFGSPPDAEASGTTGGIDNGDDRILDAVWRNGILWLTADSGCIFAGPDTAIRTCIKLTQINTTTNAMLQDLLFGALGAYSFFPAIKTDGLGNLTVVFSRSASSQFVQARVAGRLTTDPLNSLGMSVQLKAGEVAYSPPAAPGEPPFRWGDYSGAAIDPSDASRIWVVGQYAKNDSFVQWGTWIGSFAFDSDADGVGDAVDNCPNIANADQKNTDAAPLVTAGAPNDITIANGDRLGDACDPDDDNDGLPDTAEVALGPGHASHALCPSATADTDPLKLDTDGDHVNDGAECALGSDPANAASKPVIPGAANDPDHDGLSTAFEISIGTDPNKADTDGDGINDGVEFKGYNTSPLSLDTDGDGCPDGREIASVDGNTIVNSIDLLLIANRLDRADQPVQDIDKNGFINSLDLALGAKLFAPIPC